MNEEQDLEAIAKVTAKGIFRTALLHDPYYKGLTDSFSRELKSVLLKIYMGPLSVFAHLPGEAMAAGGHVRRMYIGQDFTNSKADIDIFLDSKCGTALDVVNTLRNMRPDITVTGATTPDRVEALLGNDTRLDVISFHKKNNVLEVIEDFDFTNVMCGVTNKGRICWNSKFVTDNKAKTLNLGRAEPFKNPISALRRLLKFKEEGYKVSDGLLADFAVAMGVPVTHAKRVEFLKEQYS
jgi:hypothetical protein